MNEVPELFGVLAIDKPAGITSRDVVNHVQRLLRGKRKADSPKIGHTGTLDPMATGVLLLAVGKATRLVEFAHLQRKKYVADFLLGHSSDTLDSQGQVQQIACAPPLDEQQWLGEMIHWRGRIRQTPPNYSACRVDGKRAYDLARQGKDFELASREVLIYELELLGFAYPQVSMRIECSSGTYIRSLGHDMATNLGSAAIMTKLNRTHVGTFSLEDCCCLETLSSSGDIAQRLVNPVRLVDELPRLMINPQDCQRLQNGMTICRDNFVEQFVDIEREDSLPTVPIVATSGAGDRLVAILELRGSLLQPIRVFI